MRSDYLARHPHWGSPHERVDRVPSALVCEWHMRLGFLMPCQRDHWWNLIRLNLDRIAGEVVPAVLSLGVPALRERRSDEAMVDLIRRGPEEGLSDICKAALLRRYGTPEEFLDFATRIMAERKAARATALQEWLEKLEREAEGEGSGA